jgi:uncharacterized protein (DUF1778 family)
MASDILDEAEVGAILLTDEEADRLEAVLHAPPPPNLALRDAMARFRALKAELTAAA